MTPKAIRAAGLKVTRPRAAILDILGRSKGQHLSAEDIFSALCDQGQETGRGTVYRVLAHLEAAGIVERRHFEADRAVFELRREAHHDHFVCLVCGRVEEFHDEGIVQRQARIAKKKGFEITKRSQILYGRCGNPACRPGAAEPSECIDGPGRDTVGEDYPAFKPER